MNKTQIIWTEVTWNPMSGCEQVSAGCRFCYARRLAENKRGTPAFENGFDLTFRPHKLKEPLRLKEPTLIFVNSMSDFFLEAVPDDYRDRIMDIIEATPQHQYQVLTKRAAEMVRYSKRRKFPGNFWPGVTVENQDCAFRIDLLREVEAEIRFVSAEPLLSPLDLDLSGIGWMITGGESGIQFHDEAIRRERSLADIVNGKWVPREERVDWVRSIRDQCLANKVPFFHKQWGGLRPKSAGRELDGRTWEQFPRLPEEGKVNPNLLDMVIAEKDVSTMSEITSAAKEISPSDVSENVLEKYKRNEQPEGVLLIDGNQQLTRMLVAWPNVSITSASTEPADEVPGEDSWERLWDNVSYDPEQWSAISGVSGKIFDSCRTMLIRNRLVYPDGTLNKFAERYLREKVLGLFDKKSR